MASSLTLSSINAGYGSVRVIENVSLSVSAAETVALLGTNGNCKSTLMKCIMGMLRPSSGSIVAEIDGQTINLVGRNTEEIVDLGVSLVPEGRRLFPKLTVEENLLLGAFRKTARSELAHNLDSAYATFPVLQERRRQMAGSMSGGEQQMLALARTLRSGARLLLLDEISEGLAPVIVQALAQTIQTLRAQGYTIVMVEQNFRFAAPLADRFYIMEHGAIVESFAASELQHRMSTVHDYLGV